MIVLAPVVAIVAVVRASVTSDQRYSARIRRTEYGIPHVTATDYGSLGYGYGYAFAQDDLCVMASWVQVKRCTSTPVRYAETLVLDGSTSACGWGRDPDAIEPGIFGPGHYPTLTRIDYVANSNNSPWLTNPSVPLTGYPRIYGGTRTELKLRPRLSLDLISQRLAGTDGLGPPGFTLDTLRATAIGKRDYSAELDRADLVALCRAHPGPERTFVTAGYRAMSSPRAATTRITARMMPAPAYILQALWCKDERWISVGPAMGEEGSGRFARPGCSTAIGCTRVLRSYSSMVPASWVWIHPVRDRVRTCRSSIWAMSPCCRAWSMRMCIWPLMPPKPRNRPLRTRTRRRCSN
jgi:hypothetical protein